MRNAMERGDARKFPLACLIDADSVALASAKITQFVDRSAGGRSTNVQSTDANRATQTAGGANGKTYAACSGGPIIYQWPDVWTSLTGAEFHAVLRNANDPPTGGTPANRGGFVWLGQTNTLCPNVDGLIYDGMGSTARKCSGVAHTAPMSVPFTYYVTSTSTEWTNYVNRTQIATTGTNTVGFSSGQLLMQTQAASGGFSGDFYQFAVFTRGLSQSERSRRWNADASKFSLAMAA